MKARTTQFLRFRASAGAVGSIHAVWKDQRETEPSVTEATLARLEALENDVTIDVYVTPT